MGSRPNSKYGSIKIPEGALPPVFGDPPRPPNPSIAPSTAPGDGRRTTVSSAQNTAAGNTALNDHENAQSSMDAQAKRDCECGVEHADLSVLPSDIPAGINALLSKFSTTSMNDFGVFASEAMMERLNDALNPLQYSPIHGLTAPEVKRQSFHCYLKASGLLGVIGKVILSLYEADPLPPPEKVCEHIENLLGYSYSMRGEIAEIKAYNQMLHIRIQRLEVENDWLRRRLDDFGPAVSEVEIIDPDQFDPKLSQDEQHNPLEPVNVQRRHHRPRKRQPLEVPPATVTPRRNIMTPMAASKVLSNAVQMFDDAEKANMQQSRILDRNITR